MRRRPPRPQAIDPASGFKVDLDQLVPQWDREMVDRRFVDKRNPQDFVRGVKDKQSLPYARPEVPDVFMATTISLENGVPIILGDGTPLQTEGPVAVL